MARVDARRRAAFGPGLDWIVALYRPKPKEKEMLGPGSEGGILDPEPLAALEDLHATLEGTPGVAATSGLANAPLLVDLPGGEGPGAEQAGEAAGAPLLPPAGPGRGEGRGDPFALFQRLRSSDVQRHLLLAPRHSMTPVFVAPAEGVSEGELTDRLLAAAREVEARHPDGGEILLVGPSVVETGLAEHVMTDLARLVPLTVALVALGLLLAFRSLRLLLVVFAHTAALEVLVLGGMAAFGVNLNLVSVLAPVVLVPVGVADLLHLFVHLGRRRSPNEGGAPRAEVLDATFSRLAAPMLATTLTTALGFLGFALSPVAAVRHFGLTLAAGAVAALALTYTLDAALLALIWKPRKAAAGRARGLPPADLLPRPGFGPAEPPLGRAGRWLLALRLPRVLARRRALAALAAAALTAAGLHAARQVTIEDTWIRNFDPGSRIVRDTRAFEGEMFGTNVLALVFEADPEAPASDTADPEGTRRILLDAVNRFTHAHTVVPGVRGILSATLLARSLDPHQDLAWKPWPTPSPDEMRAYQRTWESRGMALPRMDQLMTEDLTRFQVLLFLLDQPYAELEAAVGHFEAEARKAAAAAEAAAEEEAGRAGPIRVTASGDLAVNVHMVREVVEGQGRSLVVLVVVIFAALVLVTRSLGAALALAAPMVLAILGAYLLLVRLGLPYGIAVSMFPTLVVGLAVDFALHLRAAVRRTPRTPRGPWLREIAATLAGIALNALLWVAGFAVLTASALPPNRYLGLLAAVVIGLSGVFTVLALPFFARAPARRQSP